jgi:hypothetical protein
VQSSPYPTNTEPPHCHSPCADRYTCSLFNPSNGNANHSAAHSHRVTLADCSACANS